MAISITAVLIAFCIVFVIGLLYRLAPFFQEQRRGKNTFYGIDGIKPHWLLGHIKKVQRMLWFLPSRRILSMPIVMAYSET